MGLKHPGMPRTTGNKTLFVGGNGFLKLLETFLISSPFWVLDFTLHQIVVFFTIFGPLVLPQYLPVTVTAALIPC